jgi:hypothetical protein
VFIVQVGNHVNELSNTVKAVFTKDRCLILTSKILGMHLIGPLLGYPPR